MHGHIETMSKAVAEGVCSVADVEATIKQVSELIPEDGARKAGVKLDQPAPIATVDELPNYHATLRSVVLIEA